MASANTVKRKPGNSMSPLSLVAFCGGGSGGHLFPAIALAEEFLSRQPTTRFTFLTSSRPIDQRVLLTSGLPTDAVEHVVLPISGSSARLRFAASAGRAFLICRRLFRRQRPRVVIGLGGFASLPGVLAAAWLKIPVVLLETNAVPGAANRFLNRFATTTFTGWPLEERFRRRWKSPICEAGVPLRSVFRAGFAARDDTTPPTLLILGGSQGATQLNAVVAGCVPASLEVLKGWRIIHQTGAQHRSEVAACYAQHSIKATVFDFIDNLPLVLSQADMLISRSGAVTLAEIAAVGCPSLLIPLSAAADGHQLANARLFEAAGAARVIEETAADAVQRLTESVRELCSSADIRDTMARRSQSLAARGAAKSVIDMLEHFVV